MEQNSVMRNADRYQMGMQIAGTPQTVDVNDLLSQQRQEVYKGAFPLEPFPLQAITTKLENVLIVKGSLLLKKERIGYFLK